MKVVGKTHCSVNTGSVWRPSLAHVSLARGAAGTCASVELRHPSKYRFGCWFLPGIGHLGAGESTPQQHLFGSVTQVGRERFEVIEPKPNQTVLKTRQLLF